MLSNVSRDTKKESENGHKIGAKIKKYVRKRIFSDSFLFISRQKLRQHHIERRSNYAKKR